MFIARQPIFNRYKQVVAYELLFRQEREHTRFMETDAHAATAFVVGGLFENGFHPIVGEKTAYINADYEFLVSDSPELLQPEKLMIEILEDVVADEELLSRLKKLKLMGYRFALDDYTEKVPDSLLDCADVIKHDIQAVPMDSIDFRRISSVNEKAMFCAEKVETEEEFLKARNLGFEYFQGYFFRKPQIVEGVKGTKEINTTYTLIFQELQKDEPGFRRLEELISREPKMTYTLIRISSKAYSRKKNFTLRRALVNMGLRQLQRWVYILMLQDLSRDKPRELMRLALARTDFGEKIARRSTLQKRREEISLMCVLSAIDAMLDRPMDEALGELRISKDIKDALITRTGELAVVMKLIDHYENGAWRDVEALQQEIGISREELGQSYLAAIRWADEVMLEI